MTYSYKTKEEIHNRAKEIEGIPFKNLSNNKNSSTKNYVGDIFEQWFGKEKDSASVPDLGTVELKTTPYRKLKRGNKYSAKERLVLNIINYDDIISENFEDSHFLEKNNTIEIAFYEYLKDIPKSEWSFNQTVLYQMAKNPVDYKIIKNDWEKIQKYVEDGKAHDLSESLTAYLSACTKGKNKRSIRTQPNSDKKAKQRAFSLKQGYMTQMLRNNVLGNKKVDSIIKDIAELGDTTLKDFISKRLEQYIGKKTVDLEKKCDIHYGGNRLNNILVRNMLGLHGKNSTDLINIDELKKAMYMIKTIQFEENGKNTQNMSFPPFDFKELCNENWTNEDGEPSANLNVLFSESTLIFCVFQKNKNGDNFFKGFKFYNIPQTDIDGPIKSCWEDTIRILKDGVVLTRKKAENKKGYIVTNNLPKKGASKVIHIRPHAGKSSYEDTTNSNELPVPAKWNDKPEECSDNYMTTQCFFLNNTYVRSKVMDLID